MKKHWWSFVFSQTTNGTTTTVSVYLGWDQGEYVNIPRINSDKDSAGVSLEDVMLSCSYLGHMTKDVMMLGERAVTTKHGTYRWLLSC